MFARLVDAVSELGILKAQNLNLHSSLDIVTRDNATLRIDLGAQKVISTKLQEDIGAISFEMRLIQDIFLGTEKTVSELE